MCNLFALKNIHFGIIMFQTLLKNLFVGAVILSSVMVILSQPANSVVKINKNSPFSKNPKTKTEKTTVPNPVSSSNDNSTAEVTSIKAESGTTPQNIDNNIRSVTETKKVVTSDPVRFESRSVAAKTLEVAKRASAVETSPMEIYKIGIGDVLFISLQNAPAKESTYFTVLNDGTIDYPLAGEMVQVIGLTTEQIEDTLKEKVKLYENPQVSVKVREHNSHNFTVLGLVEKAGEKTMQREAIPLFVIRAEAIVQTKASKAIIKRQNGTTQTIDLRDAKSGEILIYPKEIIEFTGDNQSGNDSAATQYYYIGGEIMVGGKKDFTTGITLTQAIIESGGLKRSNVKKVIIRRKNNEGLLVPTEYKLKDIKDGKSADPILMPGDTIEIGN